MRVFSNLVITSSISSPTKYEWEVISSNSLQQIVGKVQDETLYFLSLQEKRHQEKRLLYQQQEKYFL